MSENKPEKKSIKHDDFECVMDFLDAVDKAVKEGYKVTAISKRSIWSSFVQRWLFRKDCRIVILNE